MSAELPAEEFLRVNQGDDFGWPYCYYDQMKNQKILAPEYGGNATTTGRCDAAEKPILAFPGHWAPNSLLFYTGNQFPSRYKNGAFIAFHGSWNRAPLRQGGYFVAFVPMRNGLPSGDWEMFASNFPGVEVITDPDQARYRPVGLAQGPDGSLYISDSNEGRIWRIIYKG
jgi:glucose/arabinose dehydrogenase